MTETPSVPPAPGEEHDFYLSGQTGRGDADEVKEYITVTPQDEVDYEFVTEALDQHVTELRASLNEVIGSGKAIRIDKLKLSTRQAELKASVLENKKKRLDRERAIALRKSQLKELADAAASQTSVEEERLKRRIRELESDIDAFRETLLMHRRDRDRVFNDLCDAHSQLQDLLTQQVLWKVVNLEDDDEDVEGRQGLAGFTAELLGRLLVLEKEESQVSGLLTHSNKWES